MTSDTLEVATDVDLLNDIPGLPELFPCVVHVVLGSFAVRLVELFLGQGH